MRNSLPKTPTAAKKARESDKTSESAKKLVQPRLPFKVIASSPAGTGSGGDKFAPSNKRKLSSGEEAGERENIADIGHQEQSRLRKTAESNSDSDLAASSCKKKKLEYDAEVVVLDDESSDESEHDNDSDKGGVSSLHIKLPFASAKKKKKSKRRKSLNVASTAEEHQPSSDEMEHLASEFNPQKRAKFEATIVETVDLTSTKGNSLSIKEFFQEQKKEQVNNVNEKVEKEDSENKQLEKTQKEKEKRSSEEMEENKEKCKEEVHLKEDSEEEEEIYSKDNKDQLTVMPSDTVHDVLELDENTSTSSSLSTSCCEVQNEQKDKEKEAAIQKNLTPKQLKLMERRRQAREEKERKLNEEKLQKQREKEQREEAKKREREQRDEQRRKEREEKDEQKRKEREEKERKRLAEIVARNEEKRKRNEVKEEELRKKEEERKRKDQGKQEAELKAKKAAQAFTKFFLAKTASSEALGSQTTDTSADEHAVHTLAFRPFQVKGTMKLAPICRRHLNAEERRQLETLLSVDNTDHNEHDLYLVELRQGKHVPVKWKKPTASEAKELSDTRSEDGDVLIVGKLAKYIHDTSYLFEFQRLSTSNCEKESFFEDILSMYLKESILF